MEVRVLSSARHFWLLVILSIIRGCLRCQFPAFRPEDVMNKMTRGSHALVPRTRGGAAAG
jgi:hypothetical protein